ncbi:MAG: Signal transduction histidine-protein kinase AtoS [Acidobacteria bacterium]|nr:Signal transduction histidine-protein kinase AtoS [Acidobacteriota bacterium]
MSLRLKFIFYLILIHLLFAGVAVYLLSKNRVWLLAVEAVFIVSLYIGLRLIRHLFNTIELINTGAQFIQDNDFTSRFSEVGQQELDRLVKVYNKMADHLREERIRMQEQNYFLDRVLTASPSGVVTLDFDGRVTTLNLAAERMFQEPAANLIGRKFSELNTPFAGALDDLKPGEARIIPMLGRRRVKCQRSQFLDRGFTRDFILMEELTEELRLVEKTAYEKVIRMMSHEVNNSVGSANSLLHSCLNYSGQLRGEDREDFETALGVVIGRTDHLNAFMRNFADVFRLAPPNLQSCDVGKLIEGVAFLFKAECARRRIDLRFETGDQPCFAQMDRGQMEQVFVNVLKNSIEAIGEDGRITIRAGGQAGKSFIVIEDTGCGISPAAQANLFTPFFSTKGDGQGIGLTLVQEILDGHGFEFSLESQPEEPTRFTIWF